jgi:hypothetical protein
MKAENKRWWRNPWNWAHVVLCCFGLAAAALLILCDLDSLRYIVKAARWMHLENEGVSLVCGGIIALLVQLGVSPLLHFALRLPGPSALDSLWKLRAAGGSGRWLGRLEYILFFVSAWADAHLLAGAWLAFKLGSKWSSWQHIVRVSESDGGDLADRNAAGTWITTRFLLGTLWNLLAGGLGAFVAKRLMLLLTLP